MQYNAIKNWKNFINFINLLIGNILLYIANTLTYKDKIRLFLSKTLTNNCLSNRSNLASAYQKKIFDVIEGKMSKIGDMQQAKRGQSRAVISTSVGQSGDRHLARIVVMIFQPPLFCLSFSPFRLLFFPQGVAFNRPGCSPAFFLPAFR